MDVYYGTTPFNIFNCINIKMNLNKNKEADIIIDDFVAQNWTIAKRLKEIGIFRNVYTVSRKNCNERYGGTNFVKKVFSKLAMRFKVKFCYERLFKVAFESVDYNQKYEDCYIDSPSYSQKVLFYHCLKSNKMARYYRVDCGVENYYDKSHLDYSFAFLRNSIKKIMKHCYGYCLNIDKITSIDKPLIRIPIISASDIEFKSLINYVFDYVEQSELHTASKIFFEEKFDNSIINNGQIGEEMKNLQIELIKKISMMCSDLIIKLHPRSLEFPQQLNFKVIKSCTTYEVILLNRGNSTTNDKILISPMSTSVFLPKMLFDEEPYIILLIKLFPKNFGEFKGVMTFVEQIKETYRDKHKIILPESIEELNCCLKKFEEVNAFIEK